MKKKYYIFAQWAAANPILQLNFLFLPSSLLLSLHSIFREEIL